MPKQREKVDPHKGVMLGLYITRTMKHKIRVKAQQENVTMTQLVVQILDKELNK